MNWAKDINPSTVFESVGRWASHFSHFAFFVSSKQDFTVAIGAEKFISIDESKGGFDKLEAFQHNSKSRIAGFFGYDLKNDLESLSSNNGDVLETPEAAFFEPSLWVTVADGKMEIEGNVEMLALQLLDAVDHFEKSDDFKFDGTLHPLTNREEYLEKANIIMNHLQRGDIYEANYCIQFTGEAQGFDPLNYFLALDSKTKAPFSVFAKLADFHIMSASPERFLKNEGGDLFSQPIKGTMKKGSNLEEDQAQIDALRADPKELSENVMIVDLVRNDLSRIAERGTVKVDELFGVQSFQTVHHLVSTVSAKLDKVKFSEWDAIKACYPMGSMTGAPKISAMNIIETNENFKRGAYSGAFGWMDPNGDFDFNVLIRTLFFNESNGRIGLGVGSAMTINADPEKEYDECMLKAKALIDTMFAKSDVYGTI